MSTARFRRHFLPWTQSWLPQVAEWLARDWNGKGPLDLSKLLVVVPTRQSGRRLREALAEHAASRGAAVFPPRAQTPDTLLALGAEQSDVASRLEALLAWTAVLRQVDLQDVREVFPQPPMERDFAWAWRLAGSFFRLQTQLTEGGLCFADVAARSGEDFPETARWRELAALEDMQIKALATHGRNEPHAARREFARAPTLADGIERVIVLAVPDPLPLAMEVLETWSRTIPVDVVIYASPAEADAFDDVGRPIPAIWQHRSIQVPDFPRRVQLCADPAAEAEHAARIARAYSDPDGLVGIGSADVEVLPLLENELSRRGISHYNPEGVLRRNEALHALLAALAAFAREPSFDALAALARCPDFLTCLHLRYGDAFSAAGFLDELDDLRETHLTADLGAAVEMADPRSKQLARGLELFRELHGTLTAGEFPANATVALMLLFRVRRFDRDDVDDSQAIDSAEAWRELMRECARAEVWFSKLTTSERWEVALRSYGDDRRTEEKPVGALELQGWLELLWEDAPHLIVAGMNDGLVPDAIVGDAFLPESLREKLGLKTNAARFARDAYLLQAITAARADHGRVDLLFARNSAAGDPLRPSRLLLRCPDAELPERVAQLFRPVEAVSPNLPWSRAWKLQPRREAAPTRVPVTGLRTWLACPFRFYLTHGLRMEAVEPAKSEMDARDFGTLCHAALEAMAREPALRDSVDERELRDFLLTRLDRTVRARFGDRLTLPLVIQQESARQRIGKLASVQARERAAGWVIERVEWPFTLDVGGLHVRGKIDRIDHHEVSGARRVLDYKTADTAVPPHRSHLRPFRAGDDRLPEWMRADVNGREFVWADLQLPVYLRALAGELGGNAEISCGYVNLPKAASETAVALWPELSEFLLEAAHRCTDEVAAKIRGGEFWPPAEIDPERDTFAALFHQGAEESVEWRNANADAVKLEGGAREPHVNGP